MKLRITWILSLLLLVGCRQDATEGLKPRWQIHPEPHFGNPPQSNLELVLLNGRCAVHFHTEQHIDGEVTTPVPERWCASAFEDWPTGLACEENAAAGTLSCDTDGKLTHQPHETPTP